MEDHWSRLDNAGKIYPAIVSARNTTLYRFSFDMKEEVEKDHLQRALEIIIPRYPYFQVYLKRGLFWYYFRRSYHDVYVCEDLFHPCSEYEFKKACYLFSVKYGKKHIAVEFSHSLTDGMGALEFIKSLLYQYFTLLGVSIKERGNIKMPPEEADPEEFLDGFKQIDMPHVPRSRKRKPKAFHFHSPSIPRGEYRVTTGSMDFAQVKKLAKENNQGITGLICSLYMDVFQQILYQSKAKPAPIVINMPINLRGLFQSKTMHNFFISLTPAIDPRVGVFSEEDIAKHVNSYLNLEIDRRYVSQVIKRNIMTEQNLFLRLLPLPFKEFILPIIYHFWGERGYTSGISNMGKIEFPEEIMDRIQSLQVIPPPSMGNLIKMTCYSFKNRFYVTFGSLAEKKIVEQAFFTRLSKHGIPVRIEEGRR